MYTLSNGLYVAVHPSQDDDMYCSVTMMPSRTLVPYYENVLAELGLLGVRLLLRTWREQ